MPLQALRDPELVLPTIAQTVGAKNGLAQHLGSRETLLLLDNFEHVADAAPGLAELLASTTGAKLLVTGREPLHLAAEYRFVVEPMPPDDAVALFLDRARAADPSFQPSETIADICAQLDGLPLAIELAAARISLLSLESLLERLEHRLPLLTGGARDLPERQRTLRATIDWSHELLDPEERRLFAILSVFAGSFDLEAAEQIAGADLDTLHSLVDKSLVRRWGSGRFGMLETIHEYARDRLDESDEAAQVDRRHAQYFLELAERDAARARGREEARWLERLDADHGNMRAALSASIQRRDAETALRLCGSLHAYWYHRGMFEEGRRWSEQALALREPSTMSARQKALGTAGEFANLMGDSPGAEELLEESLRLCEEIRDPALMSSAYTLLGHVFVVRGEHERARELYERALEFDEQGDSSESWQDITSSLNNVGWALLLGGDADAAERSFQRGLRHAREQGSRLMKSMLLNNLARVQLARGSEERAGALASESLAILRDVADPRMAAEAIEILARAADAGGHAARAARLQGAADALRALIGLAEWFERVPFKDDVGRAEAGGQHRWAAQYEEGRSLGPEEAIAYALEGADV
ncbi:MAG: tetratricopeptide repeat protein [Actinomycetota bacterium]|nr:tetratricopeptide repeat protein [Actinomycetota bacterium]